MKRLQYQNKILSFQYIAYTKCIKYMLIKMLVGD